MNVLRRAGRETVEISRQDSSKMPVVSREGVKNYAVCPTINRRSNALFTCTSKPLWGSKIAMTHEHEHEHEHAKLGSTGPRAGGAMM